VTLSFFLPAYRAYTFINVSPHPFQPPDAHLPPSNTFSFLKCANVYVLKIELRELKKSSVKKPINFVLMEPCQY
jgi:hypothetical protein